MRGHVDTQYKWNSNCVPRATFLDSSSRFAFNEIGKFSFYNVYLQISLTPNRCVQSVLDLFSV